MSEGTKLRQWFLGDENAARLVEDLFAVSQIADDLADRDQGHDLAARTALAGKLLLNCLVRIPANPAYVKWQGWLSPLLADAVLAWELATELETREGHTERAFGFVYRDLMERLIVALAMLIGGPDHARRVQVDVYGYFRFAHPDGQTFEAYVLEHQK